MITGSIGNYGKSGGSSSGMVQKIQLEAGDVFNLVGTWQETLIPAGNAFSYSTAVVGNFAYNTNGTSSWYERNITTGVQKVYNTPAPSGVVLFNSCFSYNNQLYCLGATSANNFLVIYRINLLTLTTTLVATTNFSYYGEYILTKQVTNTRFLFVSKHGIIDFDFSDNSFSKLVAASAASAACAVIQKTTDGNYLVGLNVGATQTQNINVYKYFTSSRSLSSPLGKISFPEILNNLQAVQLGEKLMYISDKTQSGKYTGELDLVNLTVNPVKYENLPAEAPKARFNGFEYQDKFIIYSGILKYWLPLLQTPPEENALRIKIFKGQKFNIGYGTIHINALPAIGQEAFELTIHQQIAEKDLYIYDGMYQLFQDQTILIES